MLPCTLRPVSENMPDGRRLARSRFSCIQKKRRRVSTSNTRPMHNVPSVMRSMYVCARYSRPALRLTDCAFYSQPALAPYQSSPSPSSPSSWSAASRPLQIRRPGGHSCDSISDPDRKRRKANRSLLTYFRTCLIRIACSSES